MSVLKKKLLKCKFKLLLCNIKTVILFVFVYTWLFSPCFAVLYLSKIPILGWILGVQCLIMVYFNIYLMSSDNFAAHKWFDKLKTEKNELYYWIGKENN